METHQKLTAVGVVLLAVTILIDYYYQDDGFNYAYITGVLMLAAFAIGLAMFTKNQLKPS